MKITLISPYPDITAFGIRTISAYLKKHGHNTRMLFLPDPLGDDLIQGVERYGKNILDELIPLCRDSDLIGITLMTNFFDGAVQITRKIKSSTDIPVIWGGVHPTIRPEESMEYADMVCIGDGEDAMLELVSRMEKGEDFLDVANLWVKSNGRIIKNPLRPLATDLDIYPMPDYSLSDHYILFDNNIREMNRELLKISLEASPVSNYITRCGYQTMSGRGCPHKCSYCVNDTLKEVYGGQNYLRWRSTGHVIDELLWVKENMPYVGHIWFSDDSFFAKGRQKTEEFCKAYKEKIGMPFFALASPMTISEEKMSLLVDAGLMCLQMGLETGSARMQELFNRKQMSNERMLKAVHIINKYKDKILPPHYDIILDTPYETDIDKIETLKFISRIPKPYNLQTFSLVLYPGTKLYEMAKTDGFIVDEQRQIYSKSYTMREPNYFNLLITMSKSGRFPGFLFKFLISPMIVNLFKSRFMKPVIKAVYICMKTSYRLVKKLWAGQTGK